MFRLTHRLFACLAAAALLAPPTAARADDEWKGLRAGIAAVPNSPIAIHSCTASWHDLGYSMLGVGETISFTNIATETVTAVRFRFDLRNTFGENLGEHYGTVEGTYSPNTLIENTHYGDRRFYPAPYAVYCSVDTVKFRSGRTWRRGDAAVPTAIPPSSGTSAATGSHPATCKVALADGRQIDIPWENDGCANARRAFTARAHPATCNVTLADKTQIAIPWENEGCASARQAWAASAAAPRVTYDYDGPKTDGRPSTCTVIESSKTQELPWEDARCAPARAQWASEPDWMHVRLWDSHDAAPENLVDGHPKFCDPYRSGILKDVHPVWSSAACKSARIKWDVVHGNASPPTK